MKKISLVSLASLFFLLLCSAVALLLEGVLSDLAAALIGGALIRNLTLCTYSVFAVAVIAAVCGLLAAMGGELDCDCDGDGACDVYDCCDGCDLGVSPSEKKRKK